MSKTIILGFTESPSGHYYANLILDKIKPSGSRVEKVVFPDRAAMIASVCEGDIDILVDDATSIPLELPEELEMLAVAERLKANDVVISNRTESILTNTTLQVAVTSPLRLAFLRHYYPAITCTLIDDIPSIPEYLSKKGDACILSYAQALCAGLDNQITEVLETSYFTPEAGQGCVAVLCHRKMEFGKKDIVRWWVNQEETEDCLRTERAFLQELPAAEKRPAFSYAHFEGALITLKAGIITPNGRDVFKTKKSAILAEAKELGKKTSLDIAQLLVEHHAQSV
jgi:hydroxymethylbilane synthase